MRLTMNRRTALSLLGAGAGAAFLGAPQTVFGQDAGPVVNVALDEVPRALDPLLGQVNPVYRTLMNIYDTLLTVDYSGDGTVQPALAESWQRVDGKTIDLVLRQGVKFHDGSPLTAEDVVFSFGERRTDPNSPGFGTAQQFLKTIATVEALDERTIRVTSSTDDPTLELRLTAWGSQIISKAAFEAKGGFEGFGQAPIGTGPFSVVSLSPDGLALKAFADYWNGKPDIEQLNYRSSPELSSRVAGLVSGDFDIAVDVPFDQFEAITRDPDLEIVGGTVASIRVIKFDTRNAQLKDVRVRRALGFAVDRQAIINALWGGLVDLPHGHQLPAFGPLYDPNRPAYRYDPDEARKLLAEGGYDGTPIPYRIRAAAYGPELATAQVLVAMWNAVGVNIDLQIVENFGQLVAFPGVGMRNGVDPILVNDPLFGLWRSHDRSEAEIWSNEEFFINGETLQTSLDPAVRKAAFNRMMDIYDNEDPPGMILHTMGTFYGKKKSVHWTPSKSVYMDFRDASVA